MHYALQTTQNYVADYSLDINLNEKRMYTSKLKNEILERDIGIA